MPIKRIIPQNLKNIYHLIQAVLANFVYKFPSRKIKVIGVTGTNGKTTTVQMIAKILEEAGFKTAMASTINFKLGGKEWVNKTKFTTLSAWETQKFIKQAVDAGCEYLVLETSSHSLDQNRVWGVQYDTAVMTNITREHLDYHKTMEQYRRAKLKLFKKAKNTVVNLEMEDPEEFLRCKNNSVYGFTCHPELACLSGRQVSGSRFRIPASPAGRKSGMTVIKAENIELGANYSNYKLSAYLAYRQAGRTGRQATNYKLHLPGMFNIENALAAICVGKVYGVADEIMARALDEIKGIPGRLESVPNNKGLNIIIDYAVTPDSLEKLYGLISEMKNKGHSRLDRESRMKSLVSEITLDSRLRGNDIDHGDDNKSKIVSVLGACGERDRGKRPIMGKIVSYYADYIILTDEDPYDEDPRNIINELEAGIKNKELGKDYFKILDRKEAIKKALKIAKRGDFIIITGKGAEETMAVGKKIIPWNDKRVILKLLAEK